jgi:hypothetical protein
VEMYRRDLFFIFVDKWLEIHTKPDTVLVTSQMLAGFKTLIDTIDFEPPLPGKEQLDALRKIAQDDSLGMHITALLDNLEAELKRKNVESTPETKEFIRQGIDMELASALGGREWRIRASFDDDVQLAEAIAILKDKPRYQAELRGTSRADTGRNEH